MEVKFLAYELNKEGHLELQPFTIMQNQNAKWIIKKNNEIILTLTGDYYLLKTLYCGICSTDIHRNNLPFPLPQIVGHEIVAQSIDNINYVITISDSCISHNADNLEIFCKNGLEAHCPNRLVIGINTLPGGFSPYILAPNNNIVKYDRDIIPDEIAVLIEPFAAALNAIVNSPPREKDQVAVIGPKKLGGLILLGLKYFRESKGLDFTITAIIRRKELAAYVLKIGADDVQFEPEDKSFDIVYDTTGTSEGFTTALRIAKREVHLKSTSEEVMFGFKNLTALVVNEIAVLPFSVDNLDFKWECENRKNELIYISKSVKDFNFTEKLGYKFINQNEHNNDIFINRLPCYDIAIANTIEDLDYLIKPGKDNQIPLVRPRGAILVYPTNIHYDNQLLDFISKGGNLRTSRCGNFNLAIDYFTRFPEISKIINQNIISHCFLAKEIPEAFEMAKAKDSLKVIIKHEKF
jgi:threonine dehydrogenase-like Zn-dependent dehydrogenase